MAQWREAVVAVKVFLVKSDDSQPATVAAQMSLSHPVLDNLRKVWLRVGEGGGGVMPQLTADRAVSTSACSGGCCNACAAKKRGSGLRVAC